MSSPNTAPRRIAVVLDGPGSPRWQQRALEGMKAEPGLDVVEVKLTGAVRRDGARRALEAIERRLFALGPGALDAVPVEPFEKTGGQAQLVVWLSERVRPAGGDLAPVLHLRHGGRDEPAEEAFRRAILKGVPTVETEAVLVDGDDAAVIERTVSGARPFSTTMSRDKALWKIAGMVARAAARAPVSNPPAGGSGPPAVRTGTVLGGLDPPPPSTLELLLRSPWRWLRIITVRLLFDRPWRITVREREVDPVAGWRRPGASPEVRWEADHLYADPILFEHEGRHHLFCEDLPPGANRAVISHVELNAAAEGSPTGPPEPVLTADHHLSYPFLFCHGGAVFMIPESSAEQRVELYRAVRFPDRWEREAVLLDGVIASDATVLAHDGRLWMFVCVTAPGATMLDELNLYMSTGGPAGPWRAHPLNPIVSDVRCARPAGTIQEWEGRLVRPAQDCGRRYGGAVSFREIDVLSETDYAEHEIARIDPADLGAHARAVHTYAADDRYEAVDSRRRRWRGVRAPAVWSRR